MRKVLRAFIYVMQEIFGIDFRKKQLIHLIFFNLFTGYADESDFMCFVKNKDPLLKESLAI